MTRVIGVRFRTAGKIYFFDPLEFEIKRGDHVIVETARGIEYGTVISGVQEVEDEKVIQPLKPVLRIATERDQEQELANKEKEKEAYKVCLEKIRKHNLEMKLIDAEYTFDNNKVLFYFTADGRIDFRELVKDLASVFKTRIELRQIGVRDETKIVGGIGICGRPLCCHSYLSDFIPVSIKMAKEQNLSLNPTKISGVCGRLMCCLKNEEETYEELNRRLPGIGDMVTTDDGLQGEVQSVNVLRQIVKVVVDVDDEKEIRDYEVDRLQFKKRNNKKENLELSKEELKELERLEKEEIQEDAEVQAERRQDRKWENRGEGSQENHQGRRWENRSEGNQENHQGRRWENRGEGNQENRQAQTDENLSEGAQEHRQDRKWEERGEGNQERRQDRRWEDRGEGNQERRQDRRWENRGEGNQERRQDRRWENRGEGNQEHRQDRRWENRGEGNQERRQDRRWENRGEGNQERRQDRRWENRGEGNQERRQDRRWENRSEGNQERRNDGRPYRKDRYGRRDGRKPENHDN